MNKNSNNNIAITTATGEKKNHSSLSLLLILPCYCNRYWLDYMCMRQQQQQQRQKHQQIIRYIYICQSVLCGSSELQALCFFSSISFYLIIFAALDALTRSLTYIYVYTHKNLYCYCYYYRRFEFLLVTFSSVFCVCAA